MELEIVEIGETSYNLKLFPTMTALEIISKLERQGFTPEVMLEVVTKGATIGSVTIDRKKFDNHFKGRIKEVAELFGAILKHNNLLPEEEAEEGNEEGSEE